MEKVMSRVDAIEADVAAMIELDIHLFRMGAKERSVLHTKGFPSGQESIALGDMEVFSTYVAGFASRVVKKNKTETYLSELKDEVIQFALIDRSETEVWLKANEYEYPHFVAHAEFMKSLFLLIYAALNYPGER